LNIALDFRTNSGDIWHEQVMTPCRMKLPHSVSGNIFWEFLTFFFFTSEAPRSGRRRLAPQAKILGDVS
jgi:hypothetical protein